jgi:hypothetical protein
MNVNNIFRDLNTGSNPEKPKVSVSMASARQVAYYETLCKERNIVPTMNYSTTTSKDLSIEINRVKAIAKFAPATESQKNRINTLLGMMSMPPIEMGSMGITDASSIIEKLNARWEKSFAHIPTPKQLELLKNMSYCPDVDLNELSEVPYELYVERDMEQDKLTKMYKRMDELANDKDSDWSKVKPVAEAKTQEQVDLVLALNNKIDKYNKSFDIELLTKQQVSEFIQKHQQVYNTWKYNQASPGQRELINKLLARTGNETLTDEQLMQFDKQIARTYIDRLQYEANQVGLAQNTSLEKPEVELDDMEFRLPQTESQASDKSFDDLCELAHLLYASMGYHEGDQVLQAKDSEQALQEVIQMASLYVSKENLIQLCSKVYSEEEVKTILIQ